MLNLNDREWKAFKISSLFKIVSGRDVVLDNNSGNMPYVNSSGVNNGITQFVNKYKVIVENCITIARTGTVGAAFYQKGRVAISGNIRALIPIEFVLNKNVAMFLIQAIKNTTSGRFSYGKILGTERITNLKILLPITDDGQPDYAFMEQYIREQEDKLKQKYIDFISNNYNIGGVLPSLEEKTWKAFYIGDIFDTFIPGKSKGLNHLKRAENGIPYLGATNSNNGVMCFVEDNNKLKQHGNAIGFIKNGNGSAGYSIYKKEDFVATSDIIFAYAEWLTPYIGLFITTTSDMSQEKYSHGYKWTRERLVKSTIMLPITDEGTPDYEYMEQYSKAVMFRKYKSYLEYKNCLSVGGIHECPAGES